MKKVLLALLLIVLPVTVFAAENPSVTKLELTNDKQVITFKGEMEDGSLAVMCKLYNSNNEEIDLLSSAVDNKNFDGSFSNVADGTYNVACANYEGGEVKKVEVVVNNTASNPNTYDAGISSFIIVSIVSILGIIGISIYMKKKKV